MTAMKVSDYIAESLHQRGVSCVFEVIGGMTTHLLDSLHQHGQFQVVSMHHEQAAGFAAEGFARITGIPGIALATSGPGATNLLTAIGSCYFDSVPAVFITGQVNRNEQKKDRAIRQLGFQETDIVPMVAPITKAAWKVSVVEELPMLLNQAFDLVLAGRPGPVLLDIPMDIQRAEINVPAEFNSALPHLEAVDHTDNLRLEELFFALSNAKRPMILAGGGIRSARVHPLFLKFVDKLNIPVAHSLMGCDLLSFEHPNRVGMIGTYGNRWANLSIAQADLILVLGSRLDVRQTGSDVKGFQAQKQIWHVDCEPAEINNRLSDCQAIVCELSLFLEQACQYIAAQKISFDCTQWKQEIDTLNRKWPDDAELSNISGIHPNRLMHTLSDLSDEVAAYVVDVGQHQMWAAQSLRLNESQRFITSGGMGAMGFALPTAIGVAFANPSKAVIVIAGDGGFQMNIQELQTIVHHQLPIKMIVMNNHSQGMVRQFQESYFDSRFSGTVNGYSAPDFAQIAQAYGVPSESLETEDEIQMALLRMNHTKGPYLINVHIDQMANVYPKIAFGQPITEMEPYLGVKC